jgi:hypothetical protein
VANYRKPDLMMVAVTKRIERGGKVCRLPEETFSAALLLEQRLVRPWRSLLPGIGPLALFG